MMAGAAPVVWRPPAMTDDASSAISTSAGERINGMKERRRCILSSKMTLLWRRLAAVSPQSLTKFEGWPLLP